MAAPEHIRTLKSATNRYDTFDLDFLEKKADGRIFNGEFEVTNSPKKLIGVPTGTEEIKLVNYLTYRPVPKELMAWRELPDYHEDSLDMESWYDDLIDFCVDGVWVDGEYWNPFMVYWLNVFVFPVYRLDKNGNPTEEFDPDHAIYCNIDRYIFDILWSCQIRRLDFSMMGGRGVGKNLTLSTLVETFNGKRLFGDLKIGDSIFTQDGSSTTITGIREYDPMDMYTMTLGDGRQVKCGTGHLWNVYEYNKKGIHTLEAIDIEERLLYGEPGKGGYRFHIPIAEAVDFPESKQIVDPYILGSLLGDGTKRIPDAYKYSSKEQRLSIVQGMMDADGYYYHDKAHGEYYSVNEDLVDDLAWVVRSLGIKCNKRQDVRKGGLKGHVLTLYTGKNIFRLDRKLELLKKDEDVSSKILNFRYRTAITSMDLEYLDEPSRCIEVEDESHTFLANDFIVTHNSYIAGCVLDREYRLFPEGWNIISSTNEDTTNEAWNKIEECLNTIEKKHRALKHKRITNSNTMKYSGEVIELPDGTTEERGYLSKFEKIIYGKNSGKTRGRRPTKQLIEEFAAFPPSQQMGSLRSCIRESRGSWFVGGSIKKCIVMYTGTGGTIENSEAKSVFLKPKAYGIMPIYDWEEAGAEGSGVFIPTHIKRSGTWEKTGCPDVAAARKQVDIERFNAKDDSEVLLGLQQEFPVSIKEVFLRKGSNDFNQEKLAEQRVRLQFNKDLPQPERGFLKWVKAENGKIIGVKWDPAPNSGDVEILEHPHWLQEGIPEEEKNIQMKNLYVGGVDSIDQGISDSSYATDNKKGSELAALIKKRIVDEGYFKHTSNLYVAKYRKRSNDVRLDWDNALKLAVYYNAEMNVEYTKISIVGHFRDHGFFHMLKKRPSIARQGADPDKSTSLIGTQAAPPIIDHQDSKIVEYIEDFYDQIFFPDVLEQLQDYNRKDRTKFDLVIAMGLCELSDEDLLGKAAKTPAKVSEGLEMFGYYTDPETGYKKYGTIPSGDSAGQSDMEGILEAEKFQRHGSVRWVDMTDPNNPITHY